MSLSLSLLSLGSISEEVLLASSSSSSTSTLASTLSSLGFYALLSGFGFSLLMRV